jgi:hypothetical protein
MSKLPDPNDWEVHHIQSTTPDPFTITLHDADGRKVGTISIFTDGPMTFTGEADASAAAFFDAVVRENSRKITELEDKIRDHKAAAVHIRQLYSTMKDLWHRDPTVIEPKTMHAVHDWLEQVLELDSIGHPAPYWSVDLPEQESYSRPYVEGLRQRIAELEDQRLKDRIDDLRDTLSQIDSWCSAYPVEVFPEPNWAEARAKLGDSLLTRVSSSNMRHVVEGIKRIIGDAL